MFKTRFGSIALSAFVAASVVLLLAASGQPQKISRDRILRQVDSTQMAALKGTAHPIAKRAVEAGRLSTERQLGRMTLTFRLSPTQHADLQELLREQQDRSSPNYHKWLTPEQYAARFGMSQNDLAKVSAWLQSQGLTVEGVSRNKNEISFSGSVGQAEYAFRTEIHKYLVNGREHFANSTDVSLPAAFAGEVLGVRGLDNFGPKPRAVKVSPRFTSNQTGNHFVIPADFATIYDVPSNVDGTGQTIAVIGQTQISNSDIDAFRTAANLPARTSANFQTTLVPGTGAATTCSGDATEADLDLEWSEGVAKNATIKYVFAGIGTGTSPSCTNRNRNAFDALDYAVQNNVAPIISISYGNCEANLVGFETTMQSWAQQANAQGQTIVGPAGDTGAADCDTGNSATQGLAVDAPAAIPEVTGVGGSEFTGDGAATVTSGCAADTQFWTGTCNLTSSTGTAKSYIPEGTWNDTTQSLALNPPAGLAATGGGASTLFAKPSWQTGAGVPSDNKRDVPDIALNASSFHDAYLICSQDIFGTSPTSCQTGFRASDNSLGGVGGTSAGAPTFAGILALISQATSSNGLGNVNPMLYSLAASNPEAFHDITAGDNKVPCTAGSKNCPTGTTSIGFSAGTGYDQVTGLGSLDVANLITAWLTASGAPDFSIGGSLTSTPVKGAPGSATITISGSNGFTDTVNLACTTSSSAQVSCSLNPTSVDLTGSTTSGSSTMSITTTADLRLPDRRRPRGLWFAATGGIFAAVILGGIPSRRRWPAVFLMVLFAIAMTAIGCGGSSHNTVQQVQGPQNFTVTVTATGTNTALSHSTTLSFTVQ